MRRLKNPNLNLIEAPDCNECEYTYESESTEEIIDMIKQLPYASEYYLHPEKVILQVK